MATLAANLSGFTIYKIGASPPNSDFKCRMEHFKADLVAAYTKAGVKVNFFLVIFHKMRGKIAYWAHLIGLSTV